MDREIISVYRDKDWQRPPVHRAHTTAQNRVGVWVTRSIVALAKGNSSDALEAVNRAVFIRDDTFYTPVAIALLYVLPGIRWRSVGPPHALHLGFKNRRCDFRNHRWNPAHVSH